MTEKPKQPKRSKGLTRRRFLQSAGKTALGVGAATTLGAPFINHAWSQEVYYDGGTFDAGGAVLRVAEWGGIWEELVRKHVLISSRRTSTPRSSTTAPSHGYRR